MFNFDKPPSAAFYSSLLMSEVCDSGSAVVGVQTAINRWSAFLKQQSPWAWNNEAAFSWFSSDLGLKSSVDQRG